MTALALTESAARLLTDRIRTGAEQVWTLLQQAHKGKAWEPLGYDSWRAYATAEFGMSQSRAYQLLGQARVVDAIGDALPDSTDVESLGITEAQARDIAPDIDVVAQTVKDALSTETDPDEVKAKVRTIVEDYRERRATQRSKPPTPHPARDLQRACETIAGYQGVRSDELDLDWAAVARAADTLTSLLAAREQVLTGV